MLGCLGGEEGILLSLLLRRAVEEGVQYDGGDRGQNDAVTENRLQHVGKHPEERRRHDGDQPEADSDRDDQDAVAVLHIVHRRQDLDAGRRHHAEHDEAGATEHALRHGGDDECEFRYQAKHEHDAAAGDANPAAVHAGHTDQADILRI